MPRNGWGNTNPCDTKLASAGSVVEQRRDWQLPNAIGGNQCTAILENHGRPSFEEGPNKPVTLGKVIAVTAAGSMIER